MAAIERIDHQYELICEAIEADGRRCPECYETGPKDKLFVFGCGAAVGSEYMLARFAAKIVTMFITA